MKGWLFNLLIAGAAVAPPSITFTPNGERHVGTHPREQIAIFNRAPAREFVPRGLLSIDNTEFVWGGWLSLAPGLSRGDAPDMAVWIDRLREAAADAQCDALIVPVFPTDARFSSATCIVYTSAAPTVTAPPRFLDSDITPSGWSIHPHVDGQARGMTWGTYKRTDDEREMGASTVGCGGKPSIDGKDCNAYHGDTVCTEARPILCGRGDSDFPIADHAGMGNRNWAAGEIALTAPIRGTRLTSEKAGDQICAASLGRAWKMIEFHHGGGWNFSAIGEIPEGVRFWVAINDQRANCWDKP